MISTYTFISLIFQFYILIVRNDSHQKTVKAMAFTVFHIYFFMAGALSAFSSANHLS